jgi:tRNA(Ile2) C34 agmatinyltransferase TiaS
MKREIGCSRCATKFIQRERYHLLCRACSTAARGPKAKETWRRPQMKTGFVIPYPAETRHVSDRTAVSRRVSQTMWA